MVKQGTGWEALGHIHPAKRWGTVRTNLEIQDPEGILTYRGKEVMHPSKLQEVLASIHRNHKGTIRSQSKAQQRWFWPYMEDHIKEAMDTCEECQGNVRPKDTPKEEAREYQPP